MRQSGDRGKMGQHPANAAVSRRAQCARVSMAIPLTVFGASAKLALKAEDFGHREAATSPLALTLCARQSRVLMAQLCCLVEICVTVTLVSRVVVIYPVMLMRW